MNDIAAESKNPFWLIMIGACIFTLMLAVSAYWEADIGWLHFFQAWMYIGTILLSFRRIRWGYFIGFQLRDCGITQTFSRPRFFITAWNSFPDGFTPDTSRGRTFLLRFLPGFPTCWL
jgi:hypothetical protein